MHILLVIPSYVLDHVGRGIVPQKAMLPIGPLSVAAACIEQEHRVQCIDVTFIPTWKKELRQRATDPPDIVLLSCHTIRNIKPCVAVLAALRKQWGRLPHIVLGGNACAELSQKEFASCGLTVDAVIRGYAHGIVDRILAKECGDLRHEGRVSAQLSVPALSLLDEETHRRYRTASEGRYPIVGHGFGCLWSCKYCSAFMQTVWTSRQLYNTEREVQQAHAYGYRRLWCVDNLVTVDAKATTEFDTMVAKNGMRWAGMDRAELAGKHLDTFASCKALESIAIGVESASGEQLHLLNRRAQPLDTGVYEYVFSGFRKMKMTSVAFVILDLPGSTEDDFWSLFGLLARYRPDSVSWSFANPTRATHGEQFLHIVRQSPERFGFYRWPFGFSRVPSERIVQQAMILSGVYGCGWTLEHRRPFFGNQNSFGARFQEGTIFQAKAARSPIGDIWEIWSQDP